MGSGAPSKLQQSSPPFGHEEEKEGEKKRQFFG
jgi:hypothetical protein